MRLFVVILSLFPTLSFAIDKTGHNLHIAYEITKIHKEGIPRDSLLSESYVDSWEHLLYPSAIGYSYYPSIFWGFKSSYSLAFGSLDGDEGYIDVRSESLKFGGVVRQPWRWLLPYIEVGVNSFQLKASQGSTNESDRGIKPYVGLGASAFMPIFNTGHEFELGFEYSYQPYTRGYYVSSISTKISYHFF
ncbi:hypothetical protein EK599_11035 [Vibrio sp. T187]|uniref:hypothetical protein n=1 Tax=Vibrio TaxID=662 RepID=UPI0010C99569|nr:MULTISPECIES: hypothetical protein [Vibrio]MBW3696235.1 hypothetical protein [Vibrio sp. T187]